ncbi:MAG TPA: MoxR family ATPase [Anaerolineaceae bacterium]|nr:MoxR family ATPase [Anaerolineaceae bacterium]
MEILQTNPQTVEDVAEITELVISEVNKAVIGKNDVLMKLMAAFLTENGHVLLEDYPGLAKTLIANSFAKALGIEFKRIQFTPDLLPGDITGGYFFDARENIFKLRRGPIFTQILLADEINRASPKTQSALLEAMQELQVSMDGEKIKLEDPFIVIATQNPIEYEGTFPLPEAQLDRFLIRLSVGYPNLEEEREILVQRGSRNQDSVELNPIITSQILLNMRQIIERVHIHHDIQEYIIQLISKTRQHNQVKLGVSPRGSLALFKLSRAWAAINGRDYVLPDDVKTLTHDVFCHRIILDPNLWGSKTAETRIIDEIIAKVPVPVLN